jgi:hypothetical protein
MASFHFVDNQELTAIRNAIRALVWMDRTVIDEKVRLQTRRAFGYYWGVYQDRKQWWIRRLIALDSELFNLVRLIRKQPKVRMQVESTCVCCGATVICMQNNMRGHACSVCGGNETVFPSDLVKEVRSWQKKSTSSVACVER